MIHKNRGNRRDTTQAKAERKARIVHEQNDYWAYKYFGQYRKGKIHCSCPMCSAKTNASLNKSKGRIDPSRSCRIAATNDRYGKKAWKASDRKKIDRSASQLHDFNNLTEAYAW